MKRLIPRNPYINAEESRSCRLFGAVLVLLFTGIAANACDPLADKPAVQVALAHPWTNLFAGRSTKVDCVITSQQARDATLFWSLSVDRAVIARGEQAVALLPDQPETALLELQIPDVREGLILPATLQLDVHPRAGVPKLEPVTNSVALQVFSPDATAQRNEWLKSLDIVLFDPAKRTADAFKRSGIPCRIADEPRCHELTNGLVIYGEGIEPSQLAATWQAANEAAESGRQVITLSSPGISLPSEDVLESRNQSLLSVALHGREMITKLDQNLDAKLWPTPGRLVTSSLQMTSKDDVPQVQFRNDENGWHWLDVRYHSGGRLVWLGFGIIESWDATPAARYLLLRIFEHVSKQQNKE